MALPYSLVPLEEALLSIIQELGAIPKQRCLNIQEGCTEYSQGQRRQNKIYLAKKTTRGEGIKMADFETM